MAKVNKIDSSASNVTLTGSTVADSIKTSGTEVTIIGGKGNDTLTGGKGTTTYQYTSGDGSDAITNYKEGDVINIVGSVINSVSTVKGSENVVITVGKGKITLKGAKNKKITITDKDGKTQSNVYGSSTLKISDNDGDTIDTSLHTKLTRIDASSRTKDIVLIGGKGNASILGGSGNNTLTGGAGSDTFYCGDGSYTITDYKEKEDIIALCDVSVTAFDYQGNDLVLNLNNNKTVTVKNAIVSGQKQGVLVNSYEGNVSKSWKTLLSSKTYGTNKIVATNKDNKTIQAGEGIEVIDASKRTKAVSLMGSDGDNTIIGGKGKNTIYGGNGNDLFIGGNGVDLFVSYHGNDTIQNFDFKNDIIYGMNYSYTLDGNDVILKRKNDSLYIDKIDGTTERYANDNTLRIVNAKDKTIKFRTNTADYYKRTFTDPTIYIYNDYSNLAGYEEGADSSDVRVFDASKCKTHTEIHGNGNDNTIKGGKGNDWIYDSDSAYNSGSDLITGGAGNDYICLSGGDDSVNGGAGNDIIRYDYSDEHSHTSGKSTLTGGKGKDVFQFEEFFYDGINAVITDYTVGQDALRLFQTGLYSTVDGSDVIFYTTEYDSSSNSRPKDGNKISSIRIKNAKGKKITLLSYEYTHKVIGLDDEEYPADGQEDIYKLKATHRDSQIYGGDSIKVVNGDGDIIDTSYANSNVITIDASKRTKKVYLVGNDNDNSIVGGTKNDTLVGGQGNDTLTCGKGKNVFIYDGVHGRSSYIGGGKDVIPDYKATDQINIFSTNYSTVTSGQDVIINIGDSRDNESITLKNAVGKKLNINLKYTARYVNIYNDYEERWFDDDNNFSTNELTNMIVDDSNSVGISCDFKELNHQNKYLLTKSEIYDGIENQQKQI